MEINGLNKIKALNKWCFQMFQHLVYKNIFSLVGAQIDKCKNKRQKYEKLILGSWSFFSEATFDINDSLFVPISLALFAVCLSVILFDCQGMSSSFYSVHYFQL
jgi:hypothetical protein